MEQNRTEKNSTEQNIKAISRRLQCDAEQNSGVRRRKEEFTAGFEGDCAEPSAMSIEQNRKEQSRTR